jgi:hypothetical protein
MSNSGGYLVPGSEGLEFPSAFPSTKQQTVDALDAQLRGLKARFHALKIDQLRYTPVKDMGALIGHSDLANYIDELRQSRNLWRKVANDRAKQMYATREEIKAGLIDQLRAGLNETLKELE